MSQWSGDEWRWRLKRSAPGGGLGSIGGCYALPEGTEEEVAEKEKRRQPIGFAPPEEPQKQEREDPK